MRKFFISFIFILLAQLCLADITLPALVGEGMVLQRNQPLRIWGRAAAGERVSLHFNKNVYEAVAGSDGRWEIGLPAQKAGGPYEMQLDGHNHLVLHDILVGDVWLCSGQSNMVLPMERVKERYGADIAAANNPSIRQFLVPTAYDFNTEHDDLPGVKWIAATPQTVLQFSAAAYFFARTLYEKYHVPVGIINASVGGTPVESWMSAESLKDFPSYLARLEPFKNTAYIDSLRRADGAASAAWANNLKQSDAGLNTTQRWYDPTYTATDWQPFELPGYWSDQNLPKGAGVFWFRREVTVPASMAGQPARLFLGRIIDADETYVNGQQVGNVTYQYPPRRYELPAGLLHAGTNIITVRVTNNGGKGGFVPDKPYYLAVGNDTIDLKGRWQARTGTTVAPLRTSGINVSYQPEGLFNAMIAPAMRYAITGAVWYQGESNADRPGNYAALLTSMIRGWRTRWAQDFPVLIVQLPNYGEPRTGGESNWALLREQQQKATALSNTAMAVTIDLGEWNDIHPLNKKDVGIRVALAAERLAYGDKKVVASGPMYQSMSVEGNRVTLSFTQTGGGLLARGGPPKQFTVAGPDGRFVPAQASLHGKQVVVWSDAVTQPVAVRYAWADNPQGANLYNREGLPAAPFRTDTLPRTNTVSGWKRGSCAVALTYDDALNVHLDNVMPLLDSLGLKATFYLSGYSGVLNARLNEWRAVAAKGHELGNHTLYHPCAGNLPGRGFVTPDYDLSRYTVNRMVNEIRMTNTLLRAIDGRAERSFAYPCGDIRIGDTAYLDGLHAEFTGARGVQGGLKKPAEVDLYNINCYAVNGETGEQLIAEVKKAMSSHTLLVFLFHGVGGGHGLNVSLEAHSQLLHFLQEHQSEIWIAPMTEIASYIRQTTKR